MPFVSNEDYGLEEASLETTSAVTESIKEVRGAFAFDQTTTVATASIVEVFNKAAATPLLGHAPIRHGRARTAGVREISQHLVHCDGRRAVR